MHVISRSLHQCRCSCFGHNYQNNDAFPARFSLLSIGHPPLKSCCGNPGESNGPFVRAIDHSLARTPLVTQRELSAALLPITISVWSIVSVTLYWSPSASELARSHFNFCGCFDSCLVTYSLTWHGSPSKGGPLACSHFNYCGEGYDSCVVTALGRPLCSAHQGQTVHSFIPLAHFCAFRLQCTT